MRVLVLPFVAIVSASCVVANEAKIEVPLTDTQRLMTINRNLSVGGLFDVYMGADVAQRRLAEMYVIGVLDATEGSAWCGYNLVSPDGLQEQVLKALKSGLEATPEARASAAITARLSNLFPCKDAK